jgi:hypothetical protein
VVPVAETKTVTGKVVWADVTGTSTGIDNVVVVINSSTNGSCAPDEPTEVLGERVVHVGGAEVVVHLWLWEVVVAESLILKDRGTVEEELDAGWLHRVAALKHEANVVPHEVGHWVVVTRSLVGWKLEVLAVDVVHSADILKTVLVDAKVVSTVLSAIPVGGGLVVVALEVSVSLGSGEQDTVAMYLSPECVGHDLWELDQLEGHQVVLSIEPGTSVGEDEWLLDLITAFVKTTIDTDDEVKVAAGGVAVLPNLTPVLRWEEVELIDLEGGSAWGAEIT